MKVISNTINTLVKGAGLCTLVLAVSAQVFAKENIGVNPTPPKNPDILGKMADCAPATQQKDLDVNNVRTTILNGGDMWWNLSNARYEVPKVPSGQVAKNSLFSGALWIGGVANGNLKLAAQTYRQSGNDFYPGPLTVGSATVSSSTCKTYDRIYKVTLREITKLKAESDATAGNVVAENYSEDINDWPGSPSDELKNAGVSARLAPFFDYDGDGAYNIANGDYPTFDANTKEIKNVPDMMLFVIYNDKGNIHSETQGVPIGLEFHTQAFAYSTNNEINSMTFYRTTIYNRSSETLDSTVFGQWVDADLGNYVDDYVECDVTRNLGICYNGDDNDEGILGYGLNPPSVGVTFFEGPTRPDSSEIGLTKFVYYNNDFSLTGNPSRPEHYWGYLNGRWKDGSSITYGGNGYKGTDTASFMFPGTTDPAGRANWNERIAGNQPQDRRFLQTAGSFRLLPGAVNRVTIGVVWARASSGGATGSFNLLKLASDKATVLYKNNFEQKEGPNAPQLIITEQNRSLIFKMDGTKEIEGFSRDFAGPCGTKTNYRFQGYQIWQLKNPTVPSDISDVNQARLVAQFDIVDGVSRVVNTIFDPNLEENVKQIMVDGANKGVQHTFKISRDAFETGNDQNLVNYKTYHYYIVSYATATNCATDNEQYLSSSKTVSPTGPVSIRIYSAMPHGASANGVNSQSVFGDGIPLTMVEGVGNGGRKIMLEDATINQLMQAPYYAKERLYKKNQAPVEVKVIDPTKVPISEFVLGIRDTTASTNKTDTLSGKGTKWFIRNVATGEVRYSDTTINYPNEQLFLDWGLSVQIGQSMLPGDANNETDVSNGYIDAEMIFSNPSDPWLDGIRDELSTQPYFNWIRSGSTGKPDFNNPELHDFAINKVPLDPRKNFSKMIESRWAPYALAARWRTTDRNKLPSFGPAWDGAVIGVGTGFASTDNALSDLHSVQVVITRDRSKWSRCMVLETGEDRQFNIGNADKLDIRKSPSVNQNGEPDGTGTGFGWFPGYAVDLETGERLNIMFGEDSSLPTENGTDMIWNPTSAYFGDNGRPVYGGKHYIYVMAAKTFVLGSGPSAIRYNGPRYDGCADYAQRLAALPAPGMPTSYLVRKRQVYSQVLYTSLPVMPNGRKMLAPWQNLVPSDVTLNFYVKRPYASFSVDGIVQNDSMPLFTFNTTSSAAVPITNEQAKKALDKVNIVPNPYYAYSEYEDPNNQLDNEVKVTNLPAKCLVQVYTMDGNVVRTFRKDDPTTTFWDWDLKNNAKVPISSGIYYIHIKSEELGEERVIKWFGIMRPADYDTF